MSILKNKEGMYFILYSLRFIKLDSCSFLVHVLNQKILYVLEKHEEEEMELLLGVEKYDGKGADSREEEGINAITNADQKDKRISENQEGLLPTQSSICYEDMEVKGINPKHKVKI